MLVLDRRPRRLARAVAVAGTAGSALMLVVTGWSMTARAAATNAGNITVTNPDNNQPATGGGSNVPFNIKLPGGVSCTGDTAAGGYNVQSYMVPSSVDPATLTYDSGGPTPQSTGANFREPFYDTASNPYAGKPTANATQPGGPGPIVNLPTFTFNVYTPGDIPAGTYNVGIACTKGPPGANQLDNYWTGQMTITADPADAGPAKIHWVPIAAPAGGGPTTTTTRAPTTTTTTRGTGATTTTTSSSSTSTTSGSSSSSSSSTTSTTAGACATTTTRLASTTSTTGATTSTTNGSSSSSSSTTSTTSSSCSTTGDPSSSRGSTATTSSSGSSDPSSVSGRSLARSGGHPWRLLLWGALFLYLGRLVLVLSRPARLRRASR